jgi:chromosome segregation ATPase
MLHKEVLSTRGLIETTNKIVEERTVENDKLSNQVEELSKKIVELQETHVNIVREKDEQRREIESLHAEAVKKYKVMEEKHSELFKEKEDQAKTINSLRGEIDSLVSEKSLLSRNLKEATKKYEDFAEKCLQSQHSTIAQEERSELVDIVNHMDVHEKPKPSSVNGKQNPSNVNEKPNPKDAIETQGVLENTKPNGRNQKKRQKKLQRKGK